MSAIQSIQVDCVVIGGGVVGAAVAVELSKRSGQEILVLEKGPRIGEGVTSRNSGVIHAGIYYPPHSLKAETCIEGQKLLYQWCEEHQVPFRKTGKWIVGQTAEQESLEQIYENAKICGVKSLKWSSTLADEVDGLFADRGIFSPETGIVDPYAYCASLMHSAEENGAMIISNAQVTSVETTRDGYTLTSSRGEIRAQTVINAAGLDSDDIARMVGIEKYTLYPCRGDYFKFNTPVSFRQLIYPAKPKNAPGLGVHLTLSLDGSYRLGPDAYYVDTKESFQDPVNQDEKRDAFLMSARKLFKAVDANMLSYDTCGIRPKLRAPNGTKEEDFVISKDLPGWVNLIGIESPGLTAALAIAKRVAQLL